MFCDRICIESSGQDSHWYHLFNIFRILKKRNMIVSKVPCWEGMARTVSRRVRSKNCQNDPHSLSKNILYLPQPETPWKFFIQHDLLHRTLISPPLSVSLMQRDLLTRSVRATMSGIGRMQQTRGGSRQVYNRHVKVIFSHAWSLRDNVSPTLLRNIQKPVSLDASKRGHDQ